MPFFQFSITEKNTYVKRRSNTFRFTAIITCVILIAGLLITPVTIALGVALIVFLVQYFKLIGRERYRIIAITINDDNLVIQYDDKGKSRSLSGSPTDFRFKKKTTLFNKSKTIYLAVYFQGSLQIKQFEQDELRGPVFDDIIHATNRG
ncbi:hypothetical protein AAHN97_09235 [Chitinophaga niabensis]|uniref:hypothetical protein n=1 Tax=Chitinophaga niabensis TaxID=536979 RepID=UPI0031BBB7B1